MTINIYESAEPIVAAKLHEHTGNFNEVVQFVKMLEANQERVFEQLSNITTTLAELQAAMDGDDCQPTPTADGANLTD